MKRFIIAGLAVGLIAALSIGLTSQGSAAPKKPFIGAWEATDVVDGSHMKLSIGGGSGGVYHYSWRDDYWTACDGDPGIGVGTWTVDGDNLNGNVFIRCPRAGSTLSLPITVTYDALNDILVDSYGDTWHRR